MFVLSEAGEALVARYVDHESIESAKAAAEDKTHAEPLGFEPLDADELEEINREADAARARHGPGFASPYGWAAAITGKSRPSFADVERLAEMERYRPWYRLASHAVHANPKSFTANISQPIGSLRLMSGATNYGLAEAGQGTATSLVQATAALIAGDAASLTELIMLKSLLELAGSAQRAFVEAEGALDEDIAAHPD